MAKIIINGKFLGQRLTGVQRYAKELVLELDRLCGDLDVELAVPKNAENRLDLKNIKTVVCGKNASTLWELTAFSRYVKRKKGISLNLCNSAPLSGKKIVCIHDMKVFAHPEYFTKKFRVWYRFLFRNVTKKAKAVLTVSEFSKGEILKYFPKTKAEICVAENGWQHFARVKESRGALEKYGLLPQNFYFALSSLEPNKNLKWIVETARRNPEETFAVAGGFNGKIFAESKIDFPKNIKLLGYVSDEDSKTLMHACKAFLFVTFYEGFGIPPLEALSAGAPCVIVSDTEVMHEVLGENAVYVSPEKYGYDLHAIAVPVGNACLEKYSWEKSAEKVHKLLVRYGEPKKIPQRDRGD